MAKALPPKSPKLESALLDRLADEYKILQDKIDKIGAFRFTIKGWSITVIMASILAGSATKIGPRWLWGVSLIVFLILFFSFEKQQTDLSHRFGQRVLAIEGVLSRLLRNIASKSSNPSALSSFLTLRFVPGIGHHLGAQTGRQRAGRRNFWRSCIEADLLFYVIQALAVVAFVFWPGAAATPDHPDSSITINNSSAVGPVTAENPTQVGQANGDKKNTQHPVGEDEKQAKDKQEHKSNP